MNEDETVVLTPAAEDTSTEDSTEETVFNIVFPDQMTVVAGETLPVTIKDTRPFFTTPFEEYSVTEGLLLLIMVILIVKIVLGAIKEGFYWLW